QPGLVVLLVEDADAPALGLELLGQLAGLGLVVGSRRRRPHRRAGHRRADDGEQGERAGPAAAWRAPHGRPPGSAGTAFNATGATSATSTSHSTEQTSDELLRSVGGRGAGGARPSAGRRTVSSR